MLGEDPKFRKVPGEYIHITFSNGKIAYDSPYVLNLKAIGIDLLSSPLQ
jgi:hypothetical protein